MQTSTDTKQARAKDLLAARARRISILRRRVVAGALASFVLAWGTIAATGSLATGATTAATPVTAAPTVSASSGDTSSVSGTTSSAGSAGTTAPTPVSTSQS